MIPLLLSAALAASPLWVATAIDSPEHDWLRRCGGPAAHAGFCKLPPPSLSEARDLLGGKTIGFRRDADVLTIAAGDRTTQAVLCCAVRGRMDRVGKGAWALRLRIADLDRAVIDLDVEPRPSGETPLPAFRGPQAPPRPASVNKLQGRIVRLALKSRYLGSYRDLTVYLPPGFDQARRYPVVYAADGFWRESDAPVIEALILQKQIPPLVMIGVWPGLDRRNANLRSQEYLLGWKGADHAFLNHENFFVREVMPLAENRFGASPDRKDRMITGYSSGAAWALAMGTRHPDLFDRVAAMSYGWEGTPAGLERPSRPRLFLSSGTLEPLYDRRTRALAAIAARSPAELVVRHNVAGHSGSQFSPMLVDALLWAFGRAGKAETPALPAA